MALTRLWPPALVALQTSIKTGKEAVRAFQKRRAESSTAYQPDTAGWRDRRSTHRATQRAWSVLVLVIANPGCGMTTTMREGPARPAVEFATVESRDTIIAEIDGKDVRYIRADPNGQSVYLLPAGPHVIGFGLRKRPAVLSLTVLRSDYIRVCLMAEAGHHYTTAPEVGVSTWKPHMVDSAEGEVPTTCDRTRIFPAATVSSDRSAAAEPPPPVTPLPSDTAEEVLAGPEIFRLWSKEKIERQKSRPSVDVMATVGWDFGGEDVVRAQFSGGGSQTLAAGQGPFVRMGAMVTPLWLMGDRIGLGAGADVALKLDTASASNASVSFVRYPFSFTLHTLLRFRPVWYVLLAGGVDKDAQLSVSESGNVSAIGGSSLTSRIGEIGRLGLYWADMDTFAIMFGIEYTNLTYEAPGGRVRANSAGFWTTVTWRPF